MLRVTSTVLNGEGKVGRFIESVIRQEGVDWKLDLFDADSDDDTLNEACAAAYGHYSHIKILSEEGRTDILSKLLPLWRSFDDNDIIVYADGDDEFVGRFALDQIADAHANGALITYGQFIWSDGTIGFAKQCHDRPRKVGPWSATHLKTFRAGLVKRIEEKHLRTAKGAYLEHALDRALMIPMLEMAGIDRAKFIPNILYLYNGATPFNSTADETARVQIYSQPEYGRIEWNQ